MLKITFTERFQKHYKNLTDLFVTEKIKKRTSPLAKREKLW